MSDEERVDALDPTILAAYEPLPVPEDFAAQVVAQAVTPAPIASARRRPRWVTWAVGVAAVAVVLLGVGWMIASRSGPTQARDDVVARARRTVTLPGRSVAVMEPEAHLSWHATGRQVQVEQHEGDVFYRVEPGGVFSVQTPAGVVRVLGTCFRVEISKMSNNNRTITGLAGAAVGVAAAAVVVTVYEGSVTLTEPHGGSTAQAEAGQVLRSQGGTIDRGEISDETPTLAAASRVGGAVERDELSRARRTIAEQAARIAQLEARPSSDEDVPAKPRPDETPQQRARRCLSWGGVDCSFVEPSPEALLELAKCGLVWVDNPWAIQSGGDVIPPDSLIDAAELSSEEIETLTRVNEQFRHDVDQQMREIYVELGGSEALAKSLPFEALSGAIDSMTSSETTAAVVHQVSNERAGLADPPEQIDDPSERYMRGVLGLGNIYEEQVARALGAQRAHDIRLALDGWTGGKSTYGRCEQ